MDEEMMQKLIDTLNNAGAMAKPEEETEPITEETEIETEQETEEPTYEAYTTKETDIVSDMIDKAFEKNPVLSAVITVAILLAWIIGFITMIVSAIKSSKKRNSANANNSDHFNKQAFYENYKNRGGTWDYEDAKYYKEATGHEYKSNNDYDSYYNYNNSNYNNQTNNNSNNSNNYSNSNNTYQNTRNDTKDGNDFYAAFSALEPDMAKITYSNFVKKYHPDNGGDMEIMKAINEAYNKYKKEKGI